MKTNWKKIQVIAGIACLSVASMFASVNEKGIEYYRAELYGAAKIYLENQINQIQGTSLAEAYYYIGECYAATEKLDSAAYFYQKAIQTDAEYPYSYIGEGKLALKKNNANAANDLFKKAIGFAKKNPAVHTAVAEAYIDAKQYNKAEEVLDKARSINKKFSGIYVAEGDMLMSQGKAGDACARYEMAIMFDPNDKIAYLKEARVYKSINPDRALDILSQLLAIDSDYIPAYAELGDTYYKKSNYAKAIEAYDKFIKIHGVPTQQLINYASLLYFTKEYEKSLTEISKVLEKDPKNMVMRRLQFYNNYELENYAKGLKQAEKFIQTVPQENLIAQDYIYYGRLLDKDKNTKAAIEAYYKALSIDETKTEVYKDLASAHEKEEDYGKAVSFYKKFIGTDRNATLMDVLNYGRTCYRAGSQEISPVKEDGVRKTQEELAADSDILKNYLLLADSVFTQVAEGLPDSYIGYFWRARTNASLDPEVTLGLAKPYYEQAASILEATPEGTSRNRDLIECYRYLGYYYYVQKDYCTCKVSFQKILELDSGNEAAKQLLNDDAIKKMKC